MLILCSSGWRPGDPNNQGGIEHCGEYITSGDVINDRDCEDSLPYICEMSKCASQLIYLGFKEISVYVLHALVRINLR